MSVINFSGIASGIDTNALIDALIEAQTRAAIQPNKKKVTELEDTNSSLGELKTKLTTLRDAIRAFATLNGGGVSKLASSSDETKVTATASNAAKEGAYTVTVASLAKNGTYSFNKSFSSTSDYITTDPAQDGPVSIEVGLGSNKETVTVNVTNNSTTASDFVTQFNSQSTKAYASLVNVGTSGSPSYRILITSNEQGTEKGTLAVTSGTVTDLSAATQSAATDASFTIAGIADPVTRATNTISDVVDGVTFQLQALGAATITVTNDPTTTTSAVQEFVDAYNDVVNYVAENNTVTREDDGKTVTNIFGPLAGIRVDDNALTSLRSALSGTSYSGGSTVRIFADLGITTERDGTLSLNSDTLEEALSSEANSVNEILTSFADEVSVTGGTIDNYIRFNGLFDTATTSNQTQIDDLNKRLADAQQRIDRQREELMARFARLESVMGQLQSQQSALTSLLPK